MEQLKNYINNGIKITENNQVITYPFITAYSMLFDDMIDCYIICKFESGITVQLSQSGTIEDIKY